jgi:hypothetical protein
MTVAYEYGSRFYKILNNSFVARDSVAEDNIFKPSRSKISKVFYVLLTVHLCSVLVNNQLDAQFFFSYIFIQILYMFRASLCSSSGELIVLM